MIRYIVEIGDPVTHRFSSAVRNPIEPSNSTYPDSGGSPIRYPVRLFIPKINNKISDSISGAIILPQYTVEIENRDGKYDNVETLGWFNIPLTLYRADAEDPLLSDFSPIFSGKIDYPIVGENSVRLIVNNTYRSLTEEVCKTFNDTDYPNIPDNTKDKSIPIGYGPDLMNVPLFAIDTTSPDDYIAIDPDYLVSVSTVYDSDGLSIAFSELNGIITATGGKTADVAGVAGNTIGDIITSEVAVKSGILYTSDNWDITETNEYINTSGNLNFYFKGGSVRQLVDAVLKSDNAFLFTKNNGLLTIRQWGRSYAVHEISSGRIMKFPNKNFQDALKYYNSRADIQYEKNISDGSYEKQISSGTNPVFDKVRVVPYPTDLYTTGQIVDLGDRLIKRFGILSEIIQLASGVSAIGINLLDQVNIDVNINGRQFTGKNKWIVRECDPGQDVLSLEAKSGFTVPVGIDGVLSQGLFVYNGTGFDGTLSQALTEFGGSNYDGVLSQPLIVTGEEL